MENQHRQIKGYRELRQEEIDMMNEIKAVGPQLEELVEKVRNHAAKQFSDAEGKPDECSRLSASQPGRWAAIAATDFQTGLMALTRAVAQPESF